MQANWPGFCPLAGPTSIARELFQKRTVIQFSMKGRHGPCTVLHREQQAEVQACLNMTEEGARMADPYSHNEQIWV
jgi:hypothetical protein